MAPARGDIWTVDLSPVRRHEQGEQRPALVVSADPFNSSAAGLVVALPITRTQRRQPFHVEVRPPEGGLTAISYVMCDQVRTISVDRLVRRRGAVTEATMRAVEERIRILLEL